MVVKIVHIAIATVICKIKVVCLCGKFAGKCVDLFYYRSNTEFLAIASHHQICLFGIDGRFIKSTTYLEIGESLLLGNLECIDWQFLQ